MITYSMQFFSLFFTTTIFYPDMVSKCDLCDKTLKKTWTWNTCSKCTWKTETSMPVLYETFYEKIHTYKAWKTAWQGN